VKAAAEIHWQAIALISRACTRAMTEAAERPFEQLWPPWRERVWRSAALEGPPTAIAPVPQLYGGLNTAIGEGPRAFAALGVGGRLMWWALFRLKILPLAGCGDSGGALIGGRRPDAFGKPRRQSDFRTALLPRGIPAAIGLVGGIVRKAASGSRRS